MAFGGLALLRIIRLLRFLHLLHQHTLSVTIKLWLFSVDTKHFRNVILIQFEVDKDDRSQKRLEQHGGC